MTARIFSLFLRRVFRLCAIVAAATLVAGTATTAPAAPPQRLVSLVPAITETLFALGLGSRVAGVSTACDWPPEAAKLPKVGTFSEPVAEAIVALAPDLVLTSPSPGNETAVRAIQRTGVKVAVVQSDGGIADVRGALKEVATVVGEAAAGEAMVRALDARLEAVRAAASGLSRPRAAIVVGKEPLVLAGPASYLGELLTLAGGANIADKVGGRWPRVGLEYLVTASPQVIVDLSAFMGETSGDADLVAAWAYLPSVPAVADGRVVTGGAAALLRPGPRLGEAAEALFADLHPGLPVGTLPPSPN